MDIATIIMQVPPKKIAANTFISKVPTDMFGSQTAGGVACARSLKVECLQKIPVCVPTEWWTTVDSYDNSESNETITYHYKYTVGTTWSQKMSQGLAVSQP